MQTTKRNIILENRKSINGLEISDELGRMSWHKAIETCKKLGKGWRLPTKEELYFLHKNKDVVGGFAFNFYWSSTEVDYDIAWLQGFTNGYQSSTSKTNGYYVRAVRAS